MKIVFNDSANRNRTVGDCKIGDIVRITDGCVCVVVSGYKLESDDFELNAQQLPEPNEPMPELGSFYHSSTSILEVLGNISVQKS